MITRKFTAGAPELRFRSSGVWRLITGWLVPDASTQCDGLVSRLQKWDNHAALQHPAQVIQWWDAYIRTTDSTTALLRKLLYSLHLTYVIDWQREYQCQVQGRPVALSRTAESEFGPRGNEIKKMGGPATNIYCKSEGITLNWIEFISIL